MKRMDGRPTWRLLVTGPRPGRWNMACDAELLAAVGAGGSPPTLRLFGWDPPAVSLGAHQPDPDPAALAALAARGATWIRRPTGGRAVYHGPPAEELTYAVVAPLGRPPLDGGLREVHRRIHRAVARGLARLGIEASLAAGDGGRAPSPGARLACFAVAAPDEVVAGGRKLVGSAQRRSRRAVLQHGSLPLAGDDSPLEAAWPGSVASGASTTASAAAGRRVGFDEAARALAAGFEEELGIRLRAGTLTRLERVAVEARAAARAAPGAPLDTPTTARRYSRPSYTP